MDRNYALEYRIDKQRWDQVAANVTEMQARAVEAAKRAGNKA